MSTKIKSITPILIFVLFISVIAHAQIPEGGTMLNATSGTTWQKIGKGSLTSVSVSGQPFASALRYTTGTDIANYWDAQIQFPSVEGITANDVILVAFYARTISSIQESGEGAATVIIEHKTTYSKEISHKILIGSEWKQYFASVQVKSTWSATDTRYALFTGYTSQTIEVADVRFINYKNTKKIDELPVSEITYPGQAADSPWRMEAQTRIEQIRKGNVDVVVRDENGNILKGAQVEIEMAQHQFGFGTAIAASTFVGNLTYQKKVLELFNEVVFENDLKWPQFNPYSTYNIRTSLDTLDKYGIPVRGHNVIWPSWRFMPASVKSLENDPAALRAAIDKRIDEVTQFAKGRLNDWDVINEPYSEHDVMDILGNDVMADWFKRVRKNDPDVKLYLNDYSIISGGGSNTLKQDSYYNLVKFIDGKGGQVDGIGMQGHFGSELTSITKVYSILDRFAELGKEIKITEHDINVTQRQVQAEYTRDFMTIVFSHESVKSFLFWGFWAGRHWLPEGALFDQSWNIRPHGEIYKDLVFNQWWTKKTDQTADSAGKATFNGFLGKYRYTVKYGGKTKSGTFEIINSVKSGKANQVEIIMALDFPETIEITTDKNPVLCEGDSISLQTVALQDATYQWFRNGEPLSVQKPAITAKQAGLYTVKITKGNLYAVSGAVEVKVNSVPEANISTTGNLSFCPGGKTVLTASASGAVFYAWFNDGVKFGGSSKTVEITKPGNYTLEVTANGCTGKSAPVNVKVFSASDPECTTGLLENKRNFHVYPNPFSGSFTIETDGVESSNAKAELYNSTGSLVKIINLNHVSGKINMAVKTPGFYTLRIQSEKQTQVFKLNGI